MLFNQILVLLVLFRRVKVGVLFSFIIKVLLCQTRKWTASLHQQGRKLKAARHFVLLRWNEVL